MKPLFLMIILAVFVFAGGNLFAQPLKKAKTGGKMNAPPKAGEMEEESGLLPVFPNRMACVPVASPYGSTTRYDGSLRPQDRYGGRHGGIDLSLEPGTPLLAVASGTLLLKGEGEQMEGNFLYLLHSPEDTGSKDWIITKYQHLKAVPDMAVGQKIKVGEIIALSGDTGTFDGHYGAGGYPHLHLTALRCISEKPEDIEGKSFLKETRLMDPLLIFRDAGAEPVPGNSILIPVMDFSGAMHPAGARAVWPVACR